MENQSSDDKNLKEFVRLCGVMSSPCFNLPLTAQNKILNLCLSLSMAKSLQIQGLFVETTLPKQIAWFFVRNYHFKYNPELKSKMNPCAICIQEYKQQCLATKLYCGHIFHKECIEKWLEKDVRCPTCRKDFRESQKYDKWKQKKTIPQKLGECFQCKKKVPWSDLRIHQRYGDSGYQGQDQDYCSQCLKNWPYE